MLKTGTVVFIGSGIMAESIIKGLRRKELVAPKRILASGPRPERGLELSERYSVRTTTDNVEAASQADLLVLSIKPQVLGHVLDEIAPVVKADTLVVSIVAGARMDAIREKLGTPAVVRVMPNTPAQIGLGISVWAETEETNDAHHQQALLVLQALGEEIHVEDEGYLDMATALSGTGPAYVFLFMEAMVDAGVHMGFSRHVAERLVIETLRGSVEYARQSHRHLATLRNQVTSPGGTSAEALYHLEKGNLRTVMSRSIWAAYQRARILGGNVNGGGLGD